MDARVFELTHQLMHGFKKYYIKQRYENNNFVLIIPTNIINDYPTSLSFLKHTRFLYTKTTLSKLIQTFEKCGILYNYSYLESTYRSIVDEKGNYLGFESDFILTMKNINI
jgi:hypothetical protein